MGTKVPTWYSVRIDIADSEDGWRPFTAPWTAAYEESAAELSQRTARDHELNELSWPWRIRIFEGYNRFDKPVAEMTGGPESKVD